MTLRNYSSTAVETTLSTGISDIDTELVVGSTTGWPAVPFTIAVDAGTATQEVVLVTGMVGTTLTVTRGYDSTVAASHSAGATVQHSHIALDFREANSHVNASASVHGITGAVVGTSDTQTLTNKTVSLGSNTVTGTREQFNAALTDDDFATANGTETLANKTLTAPTINGTVAGDTFGAWTAYGPTTTGFVSLDRQAYYKQVGKTVHVSFAGSINVDVDATMTVSLPVAAARTPVATLVVGNAHALDSGVAYYGAMVVLIDATTVAFQSNGSGFAWGATAPFDWTHGDTISFTITYEAA